MILAALLIRPHKVTQCTYTVYMYVHNIQCTHVVRAVINPRRAGARVKRGSEALVRACAVYLVCMEGPWHLLFNVRQRMVYMNSAEGFAL